MFDALSILAETETCENCSSALQLGYRCFSKGLGTRPWCYDFAYVSNENVDLIGNREYEIKTFERGNFLCFLYKKPAFGR
jgi:hypothetical protein